MSPNLPPAQPLSAEIDDGELTEDDFEKLSRDRVEVASMRSEDLADLVRIDRRLGGRERAEYIAEKLDEAMLDSGIRVSLTARIQDIPAGFLMARIDFGDFGHAEPVAVIDTIGVDPDYSGEGVGKALLSQLLVNLAALHVKRVETSVSSGDLALLGFLYHCGFTPAQRLAFSKRVG